jgi:hypothetical protein
MKHDRRAFERDSWAVDGSLIVEERRSMGDDPRWNGERHRGKHQGEAFVTR